ncbi:discoidin domain-containing protein [Paractinoplanes durhamensis]|uniref:discoidin domain-containing protein n=1 Tax=Paractinoplanes durhamensis TaxID=113563 RepID=UPI001EF1F69E|nr:discoidin domain-containing protein [Actinoplanes durhamensis]
MVLHEQERSESAPPVADEHARHVMPRAIPVAVTTGAPLPKIGWTATADTAASGFAAGSAIDDQTATAWKSTTTAMPHQITIDTKNRVAISGLTYLPMSGANGRIGQYRVQVSDNGTTWSGNIATGTFADNATAKTVTINTVITRYVRLTAVTEAGNRVSYAAAAEINLLGGTDPVLPRTGWTVAADSQETAGEDGKAANAIDGNTSTLWHTQWQDASPDLPHTFTIDMHAVNLVSGLGYLGRQDGAQFGNIGQYRIETSMDGTNWSPNVVTGSFSDIATAQTKTFASALARYVRLTAVTEAGRRGPWTSAAEINLLGRGDPRLTRTGWTATADSQETLGEDGKAANALDGNNATIWHTAWSAESVPGFPHTYTIDMKTSQLVGGLAYQPRQDSSFNGGIGTYSIQTSANNTTWTDQITDEKFAPETAAQQTVLFPPVTARYLRIIAKSSESGEQGPWTTAAEFYPLGASGAVVPNRGTWSAPVGFPLVPVAAAVLPNGKILTWSASFDNDYVGGTGRTLTATYDPATGVVTQREVAETGHDMFCPGISVLPDGRILVTGGNDAALTSIYDPATDSWTNGPDMTTARGYQSSATLSDGRVFTIGGSWSGGVGNYDVGRKNGEVWSATTGWTALPGADVVPMLTADPGGNGDYRKDNHAWLIAWSGNKVLQAGPSKKMNWYTISGQGSVASAGTRGDDGDAMNGNAIMYDTGKILTVGGAPAYQDSNATANAYVLTISGTTVTTRKVASMANTRAFHNSVVLPDGKVLVVGGENYAVPFSDNTAVLNAELWDPATETFTTMATQAVPRTYHSIALLLPDGRVLSAGGGLCSEYCDTNHFDGQIFTPPYLLTAEGKPAARPTITTAPATAANGATINVKTGAAVSAFSIIRMGTATHSVDTDQRRLSLTPTAASGGYNLTIPSDKGIAIPGYWMLFALDAKGVPSVAKIIKIG